ncbi:hypothetical protein [Ilumatobacter sp.]|uniref:hypothetical protein n=1 Tax=Ilumatobacter sp. TaxID=1967498 RepID=UPI003C31798F
MTVATWWSPTTDAGVAVQVVVTILVALVIVALVREERSLVLLTVGVTLVILGWYGVRSLH